MASWQAPWLAAWLSFLVPAVGCLLAAPLEKADERLPSAVGLASSLGSLAMALLLLGHLGELRPYVELRSPWLWAPGMPMCLLLDPLSVIIANVVAAVGTLIMAYSASYMRGEPGQGRYWALMCLFLASMLLLVLAGDLITLLVGWKLVGFCSYALISHYYTDEPERWVGGPPPEPMYPPSHCGLKALLTIFVGDVMMFSGIFLIYAYAGTFKLTALYATASTWLVALAQAPGMLALTAVLLMGGPLSKSAQVPFSEWLPEAMAGPTPVSALIHAATMVKAGVYVVARFLPIFYVGYHVLGLREAAVFFYMAAYAGALTAFLAAAQGCVASELKKALAYSTMSQLGYLMLGLGASGLLPDPLPGLAATTYHLMAHAAFKSALFMMAGIAIHAAGTIYMEHMGGLRHRLAATWALTLLPALALAGLPPLSGFWGKDAIVAASLEAGLLLPFALALLTVPLTAFYTLRMLGLVFYGQGRSSSPEAGGSEHGRTPLLMLTPLALLALGTLALGLAGPWLIPSLAQEMAGALSAYTGLKLTAKLAPGLEHLPLALTTTVLMASAATGAYAIYVRSAVSPEALMARWPWLGGLRKVLRARLGLNSIYYAISDAMMRLRGRTRALEAAMDRSLNELLPHAMTNLASAFRKLQTGRLSNNMLYLSAVLALLLLLLALGVI